MAGGCLAVGGLYLLLPVLRRAPFTGLTMAVAHRLYSKRTPKNSFEGLLLSWVMIMARGTGGKGRGGRGVGIAGGQTTLVDSLTRRLCL